MIKFSSQREVFRNDKSCSVIFVAEINFGLTLFIAFAQEGAILNPKRDESRRNKLGGQNDKLFSKCGCCILLS